MKDRNKILLLQYPSWSFHGVVVRNGYECVHSYCFILFETFSYFSYSIQKSTKDTTLDVGEDRLVLRVNPDKYQLDLDLPFDVDNDTCGAQYNRKTKVRYLVSYLAYCYICFIDACLLFSILAHQKYPSILRPY